MIKRCLVVLALAGRVAVAQSEPPPPTPELLDENKAMWLTVGGTIGAYTLFGGAIAAEDWLPTEVGVPLVVVTLTGTLLAPSFGHWYAGKLFTRGLGFRLGAVAMTYVAATLAFSCSPGSSEDCDLKDNTALALGLGGISMWLFGTFDDFIQAKRRVIRINEARLAAPVSLVPIANEQHVGLALVGRF